MHVELPIVVIFLGALVSLQAWTLVSLIELKVKVASIAEHCKVICHYDEQ